MLWALSQFFATAFVAADGAARESFKLVQTSAMVSQHKLLEQQK